MGFSAYVRDINNRDCYLCRSLPSAYVNSEIYPVLNII